MEMTGPEHAALAEELLIGVRKWPHRIGDRMQAANAHATLALLSLVAHMVSADEATDTNQHEVDARTYEWRMALPIPYFHLDSTDTPSTPLAPTKDAP